VRIILPWYDWPPFSTTAIGGLSVSLWNLTRGLDRFGITADVIVPPGHLRQPSPDHGPKAVESEVASSLLNNRQLTREELKTFDEYDRVVSIHNLGARSLCHPDVKPRVVRQVHTVLRAQPLSYTLPLFAGPLDFVRMYRAKRRYEAIENALSGIPTVCVSNFLLQLMARFGMGGERDSVVPIGIDLSTFKRGPSEAKYDFLFVGKDENVKGADVLFKALRMMPAKGVSPRVGIAGYFAGESRRRLMRTLSPELRSKVEFLGVVSNERMADVYNSSLCVVIPSRYETFSVVAAEAMACGVPVVASRVGSLPETLSPRASVMIERFEDPSALADSMIRALRDDSLMAESRVLGPEFARRYDIESTTSQFAGILRK
jgi:glycosyltransferase involved in cell wall biosynthesis